MTEKKKDWTGWRVEIEREKGRALIPTDLAPVDDDRRRRALANAHLDAAALMEDSDPVATATPATAATLAAETWAGRLQAALECTLPGYATLNAVDQLRAFTETQDALTDFLADLMAHETRPTAGEAGGSLKKMSSALAVWTKAWEAADIRAREIVYLALGAGHDGAPDDFAAGARRMMAFRETAREIEKIANVRLDRDPRVAIYNGLTKRLGRIYTTHTGEPVPNSRNRTAARYFIEAVIACLPGHKVKSRAIDVAIARIARERKNKTSP
jgi:hypothetical protein